MLSEVACSGNEQALLQCNANTILNCTHHMDAGVVCGNYTSLEAGDDDGDSESESVPEKRMSYTTSKCTQV